MVSDEELTDICRILSVETRVQIIRLLNDNALCVGALSARLDVTQGAVSQHLRILREAGLVVAEKRGCFVHYRLNPETTKKWRDTINRFFSLESTESQSCHKGRKPCVTKTSAVRSRRKK